MEHPIYQKIEQAEKVDFGDLLSKSFDLFKKIWVQCFMHTLIVMAVAIPVILFAYAPILPEYLNMIEASVHGYEYEVGTGYGILQIVLFVVAVLVASIFIQVLSYAVLAHFFLVCKKEDTGTPVQTGGYLVFLKTSFGKLITLSLAAMGITIIAAVLCYLPLLYVIVPLNLIVPIFAFNSQMSVGEIIRASFKLGHKYWLFLLGLIIVASLLSALGYIACGVGILFTAYFAYIPLYFFYKQTIGFEGAPGYLPPTNA